MPNTKDIYMIQTNWGYGWETETTEETLADAKEMAKCYRDNACGRFAVRIRRTREVIA